MKKTGAALKVCNLIGAVVCTVFLAGCSNVPVVKKHNISEIGASSELKVRLRKPIFLGYVKTYNVSIVISRKANEVWYSSCDKADESGICMLPATFRVKVTNDASNEVIKNVVSKGKLHAYGGDRLSFSVLRIDLDPGNYTVTVDSLTYDPILRDPDGSVEFKVGVK
jgi:hypothetical protein